VYRPYVSLSSPLQRGLRFLGHPTPPRLAAWSPAPALPERALGGFPRSVCPFSATLGRYYTPCPSFRVDTTYAPSMWSGGTFPFLGLPFSHLAGFISRRFNRTFAFADHSCLLGASPLSASSLSPSCPCTPTFDNQSPAVGQCCHSST